MTPILFLAYHFPPVGGAGVQRNSKFVRYLRDFGYDPVVVTGPGQTSARWMPSDATLAADLPDDIEIHRTPGPEPPVETGWHERGARWFGRTPAWDRWWEEAAAATAVSADGDAQILYASLEPYNSTALAAETASQQLGIPWVADLQDPWALDEMRVYPSGLHLRRETRRMREALESAAAVVMNTSESARRAKDAFPAITAKPVVSIPNGFDAADFLDSELPGERDVFRIVHTGYLHTAVGQRQRATARTRRLIGGAVDTRVDILTRSHLFLMEAIDRLLANDPRAAAEVELQLIGVLSDADRAAVAGRSYVRMPGYVTHTESLAYLRSADLLFLPMQELPPGARAGIVPGKTYEYTASGRPILAAVPEGDVRDVLALAGTASFCRPSDVACMTKVLTSMLERWRKNDPGPKLDRAAIARWERRNLTAELAGVFDALVTAA